MHCSNCGQPYEAGNNFCTKCGQALTAENLYCAHCGHQLVNGGNYCSQCGQMRMSASGYIHRPTPIAQILHHHIKTVNIPHFIKLFTQKLLTILNSLRVVLTAYIIKAMPGFKRNAIKFNHTAIFLIKKSCTGIVWFAKRTSASIAWFVKKIAFGIRKIIQIILNLPWAQITIITSSVALIAATVLFDFYFIPTVSAISGIILLTGTFSFYHRKCYRCFIRKRRYFYFFGSFFLLGSAILFTTIFFDSKDRIILTQQEILNAPQKSLMACIEFNDRKSLEKVLRISGKNLNLNQPFKYKDTTFTPLMYATYTSNELFAGILISHGANVHYFMRDSGTSLDIAAYIGNLKMIKFFIGLHQHSRSDYNNAALFAAAGGQIEVLKYFIETHGVSPNFYSSSIKKANGLLLSKAAAAGKLECCKYLISQGANVNLRPAKPYTDSFYFSALESAAKEGHLHIVKYLVEEKTSKLYDALEIAQNNNQAEVVAYLRVKYEKEIKIKTFITRAEDAFKTFNASWSTYNAENKNLSNLAHLFHSMTSTLNLTLSNISTEGIPKEISDQFKNLQQTCERFYTFVNEFNQLASAQQELDKQVEEKAVSAMANLGAAVVLGMLDINTTKLALTGGVDAAEGIVKSVVNQEKIDSMRINLKGRISSLRQDVDRKRRALKTLTTKYL